MTAQQNAQDLLNFIDASPSAFHAAHHIARGLSALNFTRLDEKRPWDLKDSERYYVMRDDSSIIAFTLGTSALPDNGFRILGAHTDSPGLKIKPNPLKTGGGVIRLGVEIYGGPILASFTDRDLSLAGRVSYRMASGAITSELIKFDQALLRLPNLAIHMNRSVNEDGLKLNKQTELPLILSTTIEQQLPDNYFKKRLADALNLETPEQVLSWELMVYDTQPGALWGAQQEFLTNSQLDNLASCHAGLTALFDETVLNAGNHVVCAFFDHEEVGSESHKGADGSFLTDVLQRISAAQGLSTDDWHRTLAHSFMVSADMAHAYQPNFPGAYEPEHQVFVNQGPVIKINANQRYSSQSRSEAQFMDYCQQAGIPVQKYSHRCDLPCGSTIGPMTSARLGIQSVDVGNPMWAMHSIRESAGVLDHDYLIRALTCFFAES